MISHEDCILIGKITKKWGYAGHFVLLIDENIDREITLPESVFLEIQEKLIPFCIESTKYQSTKSFIVRFMDMHDALLERVLQSKVFLEISTLKHHPEPPETENPFAGYAVLDQAFGPVGNVQMLIEREIQPLLSITRLGKEILIPYTMEIITKIDHKTRTIFIDAPEGLIDLYLNP